MKRLTRVQVVVAACLGVISAGTIATIAATSASEQTKSEAENTIFDRYYEAVEMYAPDFEKVYGGSTVRGDVVFCVSNYGETDEELLDEAYEEFSAASARSVREWYAVTLAYGICSTI
ncbi:MULTISPECIES: hypothetical protein [Nocardiaceae]|uniref:hypothetical protein n=1 Tax=Nocardiaceae TaxID=85025 RepID=UPI00056D5CC0|nr:MULTISPECIES: hypothetical protein [Rhodococcus]OZD12010.1 hypothetical protein CH248_28795 [Rhodococcus sp. 06-156-4a]OZD15775.1 hypothetical protein CH253_22675 [Rhodococcus sp. 06-156-3C]OZD21159.1 hypothetical protein CH280_02905 [Rhodococcus sp. 06-156-4C]OZD32341.1 hypothetical protein CH284_20835 [Rhodococcus sp. 06-156-3]OZD36563.1 hypothetical protein CH247_03260 [Rhodococcus sp. 06-156-3b]